MVPDLQKHREFHYSAPFFLLPSPQPLLLDLPLPLLDNWWLIYGKEEDLLTKMRHQPDPQQVNSQRRNIGSFDFNTTNIRWTLFARSRISVVRRTHRWEPVPATWALNPSELPWPPQKTTGTMPVPVSQTTNAQWKVAITLRAVHPGSQTANSGLFLKTSDHTKDPDARFAENIPPLSGQLCSSLDYSFREGKGYGRERKGSNIHCTAPFGQARCESFYTIPFSSLLVEPPTFNLTLSFNPPHQSIYISHTRAWSYWGLN